MLRHSYLKDMVQKTEEMPVTAFTKYVTILRRQPPVATKARCEKINEVRETFWSSHDADEEHMKFYWDFVQNRLVRNDGLTQFILDYHGAESEFFFPWLTSVYASPSAALEMAYGAGTDLNGNWVEQVPEDDPIYPFVLNDPTFVYNRERQLFVADLVSSVQDNSLNSGKVSKVADLGAGRLAWTRRHGFRFTPGYQKIYAFDTDKSIDTEALYGTDPEKVGIIYENMSFMDGLKSLPEADIDLIIMGGLASYLPFRTLQKALIPKAHQLLVPGGAFFFDLQLECPYYERSVAIFSWPHIKLMESASAAIHKIESTRKTLWKKGLKFGADYALDTYNEVPTSVMITLTKI